MKQTQDKIHLRRPVWVFIMLVFALVGAGNKPRKPDRPLHETNYKEIINRYLFINDFNIKEEERKISDEVFWKYHYKFPVVQFPLETFLDDFEKELPLTEGSGRPTEHINEGRRLYVEKQYDDAKSVWLGGRARYGKEQEYHRRLDYFIGLSFLAKAGDQRKDAGIDWNVKMFQEHLVNAATFLSWAFIVKADINDSLLDTVAPKQFYNLAAIYFNNDRYAVAYSTADRGLNFLRRTGRAEYRSKLRRSLAEAHIKNRTYLEAVKELDVALRYDATPSEAAEIFSRVGDIYFDLNNYEVAEYVYGLANRINIKAKQLKPVKYELRGESFFWMGKF